MAAKILLGILGLTSGAMIASGIVAFLLSLGIVPRYAGLTHTRNHILLYEDFVILGTIWGNLINLYQWPMAGGLVGLGVYGLFAGIFLGSWVIALAEIIDIFPIMARRIGIKKGVGLIVVSIAIGKMLGSWWFFANHLS